METSAATQVAHYKMYNNPLLSFVQQRMKDTQWWNCSLFRSRYSGRWQRFTLVIRQWRKGANRSSRNDPWHERAFALPLFRECSILSTAVFVPLWSFPVVIPNLENVICVILITIFS